MTDFGDLNRMVRDDSLWATSPELMYRSGMQYLGRKDVWFEKMKDFSALLDMEADPALEGKRKHDTAERDLGIGRDSARRIHESSLKTFSSRLREFEQKIDLAIKSIELREEELTERIMDEQQRLENELIQHCSAYAATVEQECKLLNERMIKENIAAERTRKEAEKSMELEEFALHLAFETDNQVCVRRLPKDNPQYLRCKRATTENIKPNFFTSASPFSGITVLDVFKIENKPMLKKFQQKAANLKQGSVKGLFCAVPEQCLESLIVQGMEQSEPQLNGEEGAIQSSSRGECTIFRARYIPPSLAINATPNSSAGFAEQKYKSSMSVPFPTTFSKYSTLERDRSQVEQSLGQGKDESTPQYVALCRVIVGEIFLTSSEYRGFPTVDLNGAGRNKFDSMFSQSQEEYLMLKSEFVLPEFIIRFRYTKRSEQQETISNFQVPNKTSIIQVNLANPTAYNVAAVNQKNSNSAIIPVTIGLPGNGDDRNRMGDPEMPVVKKNATGVSSSPFKDLLPGDFELGEEDLQKSAHAQREQIWSRIAHALVRASRTHQGDAELK